MTPLSFDQRYGISAVFENSENKYRMKKDGLIIEQMLDRNPIYLCRIPGMHTVGSRSGRRAKVEGKCAPDFPGMHGWLSAERKGCRKVPGFGAMNYVGRRSDKWAKVEEQHLPDSSGMAGWLWALRWI